MTITYPLTFPSSHIQGVTIRPQVAVSVTTSPFSFAEQVTDFSGELWTMQFNAPPMAREDAAVLIAFLVSLRGKYGTFTVGDPAGTTPLGTWGGTPLVNGAVTALTRVLPIKGLTPSQTAIGKAGDWIQLGSGSTARLHMVLADFNSDGSGNANADIWPATRTSYSDGAAIVKSSAVGLFRLEENGVPWSVDSDQMYRISFSAREAL